MFLKTSYEAISVRCHAVMTKKCTKCVACAESLVCLLIITTLTDVSVVVEKDSLAVTIKLTTLLLFQIYQTERSLMNCFRPFCVVLDQPPFSLRVISARSVNQSQLQSNQFNNHFSCSIFRLRS